MVLTPSERVARWASEAIDVGRGKTVIQPLVLGPRQIPATMSLDDEDLAGLRATLPQDQRTWLLVLP